MTIDKGSPTWLAIQVWARERKERYEARLRTIGTPEAETNGLRYCIREMEALLNVGNPSKMAAAQLQPAKFSDM